MQYFIISVGGLSVLDLIWLYVYYPPFDALYDSWGVNQLHCFVMIRCCVLLCLYYLTQRQASSRKSFLYLLSQWGIGLVVNWVIIILFGAYFSDIADNTALAALLSSEWWMLSKTHHNTNNTWHHRIQQMIISLLSVGSILGCWIGAFPIPLDWDRIWQQWPFTCVIGVLLGKFIALFLVVPVSYLLITLLYNKPKSI